MRPKINGIVCIVNVAKLAVYATACTLNMLHGAVAVKIDYLCRNRRAHVNLATNHNKTKVVEQLTDAFIDSRSGDSGDMNNKREELHICREMHIAKIASILKY